MIETQERLIDKKVFEEQYVDIVTKRKVYYAHSMHIYNTPQELRDIELLEKLGFEVINPNTKEVQEAVEERRKQLLKITNDPNYMNVFDEIISECDLLAYRAHIDLKIPQGVWKEIGYANKRNLPVIELATLTDSRELSVDETRQYLSYNGQR